MGEDEAPVIARHAEARQQEKEKRHVQNRRDGVDPDAVDLLPQSLVHAVHNEVEVEHHRQGREALEVPPGVGTVVDALPQG